MATTTGIKRAKSVLTFQAMDRAYCISRMIDDMLGEHPAIEGDEVATELVSELQIKSWALYQQLGGEKYV